MRLSYFQFLPLSDFLHLKSANIKIVSSIFSFINSELLNQAEYTTPSPKAPAKQKRTTDWSRWFLSPGGGWSIWDFTSQAPASFRSALVGACLSGQRPSICCRRPRCRLKAPLGLSLLRKRGPTPNPAGNEYGKLEFIFFFLNIGILLICIAGTHFRMLLSKNLPLHWLSVNEKIPLQNLWQSKGTS